MRIRQKLLLVFLFIGVVPIVGIGILTFRRTADALRKHALSKLELVTDLKVKRLELFIDSVGADLQIAQDYYNLQDHVPVLTTFANHRTAPEYLAAVAALDRQLHTFATVKGYMDVVLADPQGRIVYRIAQGRSDLELDRFLADVDPEGFQGAQKGVYIAQVFLDRAAGNTFFMLATAPIRGPDGIIVGFLAFQLPMRTIYAAVQDSTGLGKTGETLIGTLEGQEILFLTPLRHVENAALTHRVRMGEPRALPMQAAVSGKVGSGVSVDYRGEEVLAAWRHIPSVHWGMVAKTDAREAFAPVRVLQVTVLVISLIVLVVVMLLALGFAESLSKPIRALQRGAEIIRQGDRQYSVRTNATDEIGRLSRAFDDMVEALREKSLELEDSNKELQNLLYVTSHDLKEPLAGIEMLSRLVQDEYAPRLDTEGQDVVQRIVAASLRMRGLLDDLLALSRARTVALPTEEVEGGVVVQDAVTRLEQTIKRTGAKVTVESNLPRLFADRTWATQGVYNLVGNALKYTRPGQTPEVEIAAFRPNGTAGDEVGVVVRDRGLGVAPEDAERIFGLFQRAVGKEIEGHGAGLAIVRAVAQRHAGRAWVTPRDGGGSEFVITFGSRQRQETQRAKKPT